MDYAGIVDEALERLRAEGRYRTFAEIERIPGTAGATLRAVCSFNSEHYLVMGRGGV